jgi:hypothetical protein
MHRIALVILIGIGFASGPAVAQSPEVGRILNGLTGNQDQNRANRDSVDRDYRGSGDRSRSSGYTRDRDFQNDRDRDRPRSQDYSRGRESDREQDRGDYDRNR